MKGLSNYILAILILSITPSIGLADEFVEKIPVYAIVQPGSISTLLAVNNGMVNRVSYDVGDKVVRGRPLMTVIEKETTRPYRTTLTGRVAKLHVTNGAAVTPGMPLITVINPDIKKIEVSLSPEEAQKVQIGAEVYQMQKDKKSILFGKVAKVSPLVDPDTGAVKTYIAPNQVISNIIGDVIPLEIGVEKYTDCKVVKIKDVDSHISGKQPLRVIATAGDEACLKASKTQQ